MIIELGHFALVLALPVAAAQALLPLTAHTAAARSVAIPAARMQFLLIALAFLALMNAHLHDDFSVLNVIQHSHTLKPLLYKFAGVWGNHEGSFLLWLLLLSGFGAALSFTVIRRRTYTWIPNENGVGYRRADEAVFDDTKLLALAVQGLIGAGFLSFILFTSNPFARVFPPLADGEDLNPLLQDFALAIHPPLLYAGYVGFSVVFALAVGFLLHARGQVNEDAIKAWAASIRPWTIIAWASLTIGIALGSWWAYYELGWGGFWFWDPVENASLMPWFVGTALMHCVMVTAQRGLLLRWTLLLAIVAFSLSMLGTFLVRSGVLISVHAFANDPARGVWILLLLALFAGGALLLFALRAPATAARNDFVPLSRETLILLNNVFLLAACGTVLLGTIYPLLLTAFNIDIVSVGPPYFMKTCVPLIFPILILMVFGPLTPWKQATLDQLKSWQPLRWAVQATLACVIAMLVLEDRRPVMGLIGGACGLWLVFGSIADGTRKIRRPFENWTKLVAHGCFGLSVLGMAGSFWTTETIMPLEAGQKMTIAGYTLEFDGVKVLPGKNFIAEKGTLKVWRGNAFVTTMQPQRRWYPAADMRTTEAAIITNGLADLYVTLGEPLDAKTGEPREMMPKKWSVRALHQPLAPWIWIGAILTALAGLAGLWQNKREKKS